MRNGKVATKRAGASAKAKRAAPSRSRIATHTESREAAGPSKAAPRVSTASETAFLILDEQFDTLLQEEKNLRQTGERNSVHDMRVACRRIRAAMRAFASFLNPGLLTLESQVKWIFSLLGDVRDLDICIELLNAQTMETALHTAEEIAASLQEERSKAFAKLLSALDSPRYQELIQDLQRELHKGPQPTNTLSGTPILAAAPDIVGHEFRVVRKAGEDLEPGADALSFHSLRKRAKRFRYTLEFVKPLYGKRCEKVIDKLKELQEMLGDRQDQIMFAERVESLAGKGKRKADFIRCTVELSENARDKARNIEEQFPSAFAAVAGKPWSRLSEKMKEQRRELWA